VNTKPVRLTHHTAFSLISNSFLHRPHSTHAYTMSKVPVHLRRIHSNNNQRQRTYSKLDLAGTLIQLIVTNVSTSTTTLKSHVSFHCQSEVVFFAMGILSSGRSLALSASGIPRVSAFLRCDLTWTLIKMEPRKSKPPTKCIGRNGLAINTKLITMVSTLRRLFTISAFVAPKRLIVNNTKITLRYPSMENITIFGTTLLIDRRMDGG
jgi:hypothetical protein